MTPEQAKALAMAQEIWYLEIVVDGEELGVLELDKSKFTKAAALLMQAHLRTYSKTLLEAQATLQK